MSYELINRISIKKQGVYLSTHSNNDTAPYRSKRIDFLSRAYAQGGQLALDIEIIRLVSESAEFRGNHKSILKYKNVFNTIKYAKIHQEYTLKTNMAFNNLSDEDKQSEFKPKKTIKMQEYLAYEEKCRNEKYEKTALLLN